MQHRDDILPKLQKAGVNIFTDTKLIKTGNGFIEAEQLKEKKILRLPCDKVVLALGSRSENRLAKELEKDGFAPIVIGDALKVGKIADATKAAYMAAISIH